jgi:hypothetical protein
VTDPLRVTFNPDLQAWGVWANRDWFIPLPPA